MHSIILIVTRHHVDSFAVKVVLVLRVVLGNTLLIVYVPCWAVYHLLELGHGYNFCVTLAYDMTKLLIVRLIWYLYSALLSSAYFGNHLGCSNQHVPIAMSPKCVSGLV